MQTFMVRRLPTILIVDDESTLRDIYATKFGREGFHTCTACDGCEALQRIVSDEPSLVLLDIVMPERAGIYDGFDVLKRIRKDDRTSMLPVVVMTNLGLAEDIRRGRELGATEYIVKTDATPEEVVKVVERVLGIA